MPRPSNRPPLQFALFYSFTAVLPNGEVRTIHSKLDQVYKRRATARRRLRALESLILLGRGFELGQRITGARIVAQPLSEGSIGAFVPVALTPEQLYAQREHDFRARLLGKAGHTNKTCK